jgi:hypothetical protein
VADFNVILPVLSCRTYRHENENQSREHDGCVAAGGLLIMPRVYYWLAMWAVSLVEFVLVLAVLALVFLRSKSKPASAGLQSAERWLRRLAQRRALSVVAVGLATLFLRAALIPVLGIPEPSAHDEFSYLLAADTFAHGRLTNPAHPMWIHFESFHIIQQPTYMSKYPPAEGVVLAVGEILGRPWIGQLLVTALMCSALCWMLQGWMPPAWALLGGGLAVLRLGTLSYWMNGYWCASVVALGGALVLGAWPRIRHHLRPRDAFVMGVGLVVLATSRPYEGLVFALPFAVAMLGWLAGPRHPRFSTSFTRVVAPLFLTLSLAAAASGYYNHRLTGDALLMPYQVNQAAYGYAPFFLWQKPTAEPTYHHEVMRKFYEADFRDYQEWRTPAGFLEFKGKKFVLAWAFFFGPTLSLGLISLPRLMRDRRMRFPLIAGSVFLLGLLPETWCWDHYFAPATGLAYLIAMQGMRHLRLWRWHGRPVGVALVRSIPLIACALVMVRASAILLGTPVEPSWPRGDLIRAGIRRSLENSAGEHLILVRYGAGHAPESDWVYNDADIDGAKVVWARDMGERNNRELLQYFRNRKVWKVDPDEVPLRLEPVLTDVPGLGRGDK